MTVRNSVQWHTFAACFLGWALDAFDFFLLVFVARAIAADFRVAFTAVTMATTVTLATRPIGAFVFGWAADRWGRRPTLMANVVCYSAIELLSAAAPSLGVLIALRALYGVAMGGEWGVGAALALESVPADRRGFFSGLLQEGYMFGYLLAAGAFWLVFPHWGWRGMFVVGALPAVLVLYIRSRVPESPSWGVSRGTGSDRPRVLVWSVFRTHWKMMLYAVLLMTAFNAFSHGTQDSYPTMLQSVHGLTVGNTAALAAIAAVGAILGGVLCGALSEHFGRRRVIIAAALLALPVVPLWAFGHTLVSLAAGAFLLQFMVQGAWGVVPVHLNELAPDDARGVVPGFAYQLGNLLAAATMTTQAVLARSHGGRFDIVLAGTVVIVAVVLAIVTGLGPEAKGVAFGRGESSG